MNPNLQIALSFALTFGVPIAFAARELLILRKPRDGGRPDEPPAPPRPQRPLPDCLIPKPMATRPARVLETA